MSTKSQAKTHRPRVLVLGWYDQSNMGDESFKTSIRELWPDYDFVFKSSAPRDLEKYDGCLLGGGSFLDAKPFCDEIPIPYAFVGVGAGSYVSPEYLRLLGHARAIVVRDHKSSERLLSLGIPAKILFTGSDLFYAREVPEWEGEDSKRILVCPSEHFVPRGVRPSWFHKGWEFHRDQMATVLDILSERGYDLRFLPFCLSNSYDDRRPAAEIISRMVHAGRVHPFTEAEKSESGVLEEISKARLVLSMRLHGMIFADAVGTPMVAICGHDKMYSMIHHMAWKHWADYFKFSWRRILSEVDGALSSDPYHNMPRKLEEKGKWLVASEFVARRLFP